MKLWGETRDCATICQFYLFNCTRTVKVILLESEPRRERAGWTVLIPVYFVNYNWICLQLFLRTIQYLSFLIFFPFPLAWAPVTAGAYLFAPGYSWPPN